MSQKLLTEEELILIETAMKSGDEYSDEDLAFNRLLSDVRGLREAIAKVPLSFDSDEDGRFWYTCQFCNEESDESEAFSHADNCIYIEVVQGGK